MIHDKLVGGGEDQISYLVDTQQSVTILSSI